jgi:hypothetical protein
VPSPDTGPAELLAALAEGLSALGARWFLFGAQATILWGRPRLTADVDVTVRLDVEDVPRLVDVLRARGFQLRIDVADDFVRRTRVLPLIYLPNGLPLDIVLAGTGLEEVFLERAVMVQLGDITVPVISPEDLIVAKILAGRPKDLDDVRGVLRERLQTLDLSVIRSTLGELEEALSRSDLLPSFESELARARSRRTR